MVNLRLQDAVAATSRPGKAPEAARAPDPGAGCDEQRRAERAPDMRVNDAWQTLAESRVAQAPVVDERGRVIGLLLRADMAPLDLLPEPGAVGKRLSWPAGRCQK